MVSRGKSGVTQQQLAQKWADLKRNWIFKSNSCLGVFGCREWPVQTGIQALLRESFVPMSGHARWISVPKLCGSTKAVCCARALPSNPTSFSPNWRGWTFNKLWIIDFSETNRLKIFVRWRGSKRCRARPTTKMFWQKIYYQSIQVDRV